MRWRFCERRDEYEGWVEHADWAIKQFGLYALLREFADEIEAGLLDQDGLHRESLVLEEWRDNGWQRTTLPVPGRASILGDQNEIPTHSSPTWP